MNSSPGSKPTIKISPDICFGATAVLLLLAVWSGKPFGNYTRFGAFLLIPAVLCCAAGIFTSSADLRTQNENHRRLLWALVCTAMLYHLVMIMSMIRAQGGPRIDVYLFQHHSAAALLRGIDPYTLTTENIYGPRTTFYDPSMLANGRVQIGLPYPPASLLFVLPGYFLGDVRYPYIVAVLLCGAALVKSRTTIITAGTACLLLLSPVTLYVELQSWTEPFVLLALTSTVYAALKGRRWLPIALGIFFASKQYSIFALPFVPLLMEQRDRNSIGKLLVQALSTTAILTLPLALWNRAGFWRNIVVFQLHPPSRKDALTLGNLFPQMHLPTILILTSIGVVFAILRVRRHPSMFAACFGFVLLIFVCTGKQAFCNYYFLIVQSLLLGVATNSIQALPELPSQKKQLHPLVGIDLEQVGQLSVDTCKLK